MHNWLLFSVLGLLLLVGSLDAVHAASKKGTLMLAADFEKDFCGFRATTDTAALRPCRTKARAFKGTYSLCTQGGIWTSPFFPVTPFAYYQLSFASLIQPTVPAGKWAWGGHWAAYFYDKDGQALCDHYSYIDASDAWQQQTFTFRAKADAAYCSIRFHATNEAKDALYIDDVRVTTIAHPAVAAWADHLYAQLPPITVTPPTDRWQHLPKTMARLRAGGTLRVVMLGDSIVNDTGNSPWDTLVEKMYPKAHLEVVTAVRGGTGCGYYKLENRVKEYILAYHPDLVIIGGVSNDTAESVREVIHQVRAASSPEFLLLTPAMAYREQYAATYPHWSATVDPDGTGYRSQLLRVAADEGADFLDFTGPWGLYTQQCGKPYEWYQRDILHANERGRAILGRILAGYFAPKAQP